MSKAKTPSMNAMLNYLHKAWGGVSLDSSRREPTANKWQCSEKVSMSYSPLWFVGPNPLTAVRRAYKAVRKGAKR